MASPTTAMADGGARLASELATVEAETREERERGGRRSSPWGHTVARWVTRSSRDGAGDEEDRRQLEMGTRTNGGCGAFRFQRRVLVEGVDPGRAHRQGQRARGRRWPRQ